MNKTVKVVIGRLIFCLSAVVVLFWAFLWILKVVEFWHKRPVVSLLSAVVAVGSATGAIAVLSALLQITRRDIRKHRQTIRRK